MPPITITTKARISTGSPMPTCTDWIVPTSAPASPASAAPSAKTSVYSRSISTPSAAIISRSASPARIRMPSRVCPISQNSPPAIPSPIPMIASRYSG